MSTVALIAAEVAKSYAHDLNSKRDAAGVVSFKDRRALGKVLDAAMRAAVYLGAYIEREHTNRELFVTLVELDGKMSCVQAKIKEGGPSEDRWNYTIIVGIQADDGTIMHSNNPDHFMEHSVSELYEAAKSFDRICGRS